MEFYKHIADYYEYIFPLNNQQVKFILEKVPPINAETNLLDLGCAVGTLLFELDKYYPNLIGIDLDEYMIQLAKERTYINKPQIFAGNMLQFPEITGETHFNGIVCFGNTLVHLPNKQSIHQLFKTCYKHLKDGGKLLLQIINYDRILDQNINSLPTIENEKVKFVRNYILNETTHSIDFNTLLTIKNSDVEIVNSQPLLALRKDELISMLKTSGFMNISCYSSFNGEPFNIDAIPLVIEATK